MEISARFNFDKLDHSQDTNPHLVVTLKAPVLDWVKKRPSLCVLPLVDLSGSMQGEKLNYAKKSLLKLVDHLQEGDVAGLVGFESRAHILVPPGPVSAQLKATLRKTIEDLHVRGGTNFSDGLLKAIEVVQDLDLAPKYLKRIIMFTDGEPTEGVTSPEQILKLMSTRRSSVTVSAFGYGSVGGGAYGGCDPDFLNRLSQEGEGNFAFVKDPDDALAAFGKELGGLLSTYATNLDIEVEPAGAHKVSRVVTNIEHEEDGVGTYNLSAPSILSEEVRHFVFETKCLAQPKAFPRATTIFNVRVTYSLLTEDGTRESKTVTTKARVQFVRPADASTVPVKEVDEIVSLHKMVRAQLDAEELAKKGQFQAATGLMTSVAQEAVTRGYLGLASAANQVGARFGSAGTYASSQGFLRSTSNATRTYGISSMDADAGEVFQHCSLKLDNNAMSSMTEAFTAPVAPTAPVTPASAKDASTPEDPQKEPFVFDPRDLRNLTPDYNVSARPILVAPPVGSGVRYK